MPRIPTLEQLCMAALSEIAVKHNAHIDRGDIDASSSSSTPFSHSTRLDLRDLPTDALVGAIEGLKRPSLYASPPPTDEEKMFDGYQTQVDEQDSDTDDVDERKAVTGLHDRHLLPFLRPHLHEFNLDLESVTSPPATDPTATFRIGAAHNPLSDTFLARITHRTIDHLASTCHQLIALNLTGYRHPFTTSQLDAFSRLDLHTLVLSHCQMSLSELEFMVRSYRHLATLKLSWLTGLMRANERVDVLEDIIALLSQPSASSSSSSSSSLRTSLRHLYLDGSRTNPNELIWRLLHLLPQLAHLNIDSVTPPEHAMTREEEEEERRREKAKEKERAAAGEAATPMQAIDEGSDDSSTMISELIVANLKLKSIFDARQSQSAASALSSSSSSAISHSSHFPNLTGLSSIASDKLSSDTLLLLLPHTPNLRHLVLKGCSRISNEVVLMLAHHCRQIETLNLADIQGIQSEAIWELEQAALPKEQQTRRQRRKQANAIEANADQTNGGDLNEDNKPVAADAGRPTTLFSSASSSSTCAAPFSSFPTTGSALRYIDLSWCENISPLAIGDLFGMPSSSSSSSHPVYPLERVILSCLEELDESVMRKLLKHTQLAELDLSRCVQVQVKTLLKQENKTGTTSSLSSPSLPIASSVSSPFPWSSLVKLNLSWTSIDNEDLRLLTQLCPLLQSLNLEGCKHLTDDCIEALVISPSSMFNLNFISFFFVNQITLGGILQLLHHSTCYWLFIRDYWGDGHHRHTIEADEKEAGINRR